MQGPWNWIDWILAGVVAASVVAAILKGFVRELISLAGLVVGVVIAATGYQRAAVWFEDVTRSREVALGAAFLTLFLATQLVSAALSWLAKKLIKTAGMQWFDRFLGAVFGLIRGVVIDCVVLMALVAFTIKVEPVQQSTLAPYVTSGARVIVLAMPDNLKAHFRGGLEKFRQGLAQADRKARN